MDAGDAQQRRDAPPMIYRNTQGRYLDGQGRPDPPDAGDETATLLGFLERQTAPFAWKCSGLDAAGLRATAGASAMSLGGMLKPLARFEDDMTSEWLHGEAQRPPWNRVDWEADPAWVWRSAADDTPKELYARWQEAVERFRALLTAALAEGGLERRGGGGLPRLRSILLNMIEEYARHNGHVDLLREAVDGRVGHDPPE